MMTAGMMYQHQHARSPVEQLKDIPQPVVVLLEVLLEKDPGHRFQNPAELLKAIPTITGAIDARRRITRQSLQKTSPATSRVGTRKAPARLAPKKISIARLPVTHAGAKPLRALGVKGDEAELRSAGDEFSGHCLVLTLLGSYLMDAYHGDIRRREVVSARLAQDLRQGAHARKVMESYQT